MRVMKIPKPLGILVLALIVALLLFSLYIPRTKSSDASQTPSEDDLGTIQTNTASPSDAASLSDVITPPLSSHSPESPSADNSDIKDDTEESTEIEEQPVIPTPFEPYSTELTDPGLMIASDRKSTRLNSSH